MTTQSKNTTQFVSIEREGGKCVFFTLSIVTNIKQSAASEALLLVYSEMLLAGCGTLSRESFLDTLATLGAEITVSSQHNVLRITVKTQDGVLDKVLKLFTLLLQKPTFAAKELTRVKEYLKNNLNLEKENAPLRSQTAFSNKVLGKDDRRYIHEIDTVIKEISKVSKSQLARFHAQIPSQQWYCAAGGNASKVKKIRSTIEAIFKKSNEVDVEPQAPLVTIPTVLLTNIPHKQNVEFTIGATVPILRNHTDFPALVLGISILGLQGGFSGRLMSTVREKEGLTYGIYATLSGITHTEYGYWKISTFFAPQKVVQGLESVKSQLARIIEEGITHDELLRFKTILRTRTQLIKDSLIKEVREMHAMQMHGMSLAEYMQYQKCIEVVTLKEVNAAVSKYLHSEHICISGAGPVAEVQKDLQKFGTVFENPL
jgi:zinc protease